MEQIYLKQLVGSRFFNINRENSDTDMFVIWNGPTQNKPGRPHCMYHNLEDGADKILGMTNNFFQIIDGIGKNLEGKESLIQYLNQNIEEIKSKNIGFSYNYFKDYVNQTPFNEVSYNRNPKRIGHILLYQKIFIDYANGLPLRAALRVEGLTQFLQAARQGRVEWKEVETLEKQFLQDFMNSQLFYKDKKDLTYAKKEKQNLLQIMGGIVQ